ncbi:hypothetical protein D9M68_898600 [compost metagenome]
MPGEQVAGQADVRFQRQRGARLLARQRGQVNALVFGVHIAPHVGRGAQADGHMTVALAMPVEDVQQVARPRRYVASDQRFVESAVGPLPLLRIARDAARFGFAQFGKGLSQRPFPQRIALPDRLAQGLGLQPHPRVGQVAQVFQ